MESEAVDREAVLKSLVQSDPDTEGQPRKRRRLDNLTPDERALRRFVSINFREMFCSCTKLSAISLLHFLIRSFQCLFLAYFHINRKLKNRVAAQTARDRKKVRMGDLEEAVERLEKEVFLGVIFEIAFYVHFEPQRQQ